MKVTVGLPKPLDFVDKWGNRIDSEVAEKAAQDVLSRMKKGGGRKRKRKR